MAVTWEDVANKRFQPTKFRAGYDQDEVDDFLDEVALELRRLAEENEELRSRAAAAPAPAAGVPAKAQRPHAECLGEGEQRGAALVAEAEATAARVVHEAQEAAEQSLSAMATGRTALESEVERLRGVEAEYRSRVSAHLEGRPREIQDGPRAQPGADPT